VNTTNINTTGTRHRQAARRERFKEIFERLRLNDSTPSITPYFSTTYSRLKLFTPYHDGHAHPFSTSQPPCALFEGECQD
jgi:hypothetical protein